MGCVDVARKRERRIAAISFNTYNHQIKFVFVCCLRVFVHHDDDGKNI